MMIDHSVGVPGVRELLPPGSVYDYDYMCQRLAAEAPFWAICTKRAFRLDSRFSQASARATSVRSRSENGRGWARARPGSTGEDSSSAGSASRGRRSIAPHVDRAGARGKPHEDATASRSLSQRDTL